MTATAKTVTYTAEQTTELVDAYVAAPTEATVTAFAEKFGKSVRSIVAKLSREKVYVAKATKAKAATETKADLAKVLEARFELKAGTLESLEKATKEALVALVKATDE